MSHTASIPASPLPFRPDWKAVESGLPLSALEDFAKYSRLDAKDLLEVVIPARTLKHRRQRREPSSLDESDRLARLVRVFEMAVKIYDDRADALAWLKGSMRRFEGGTPLAMRRTAAGEQAVVDFLIQVDEGYFAWQALPLKIFWRISRYADLSGAGGRLASARWHTRARPIVYLVRRARCWRGSFISSTPTVEFRAPSIC